MNLSLNEEVYYIITMIIYGNLVNCQDLHGLFHSENNESYLHVIIHRKLRQE